MFITYAENGLVTAYSDKSRNPKDLLDGETEVEVDMEYAHVACVEGGLIFTDDQLKNNGVTIANKVLPFTDIE